jgi:hypothetical protein
MAKKNNKKNHSFFKTIKSSIPSNRVLYSILGGVGAGLAIGTAMDKDKRQALADKATSTFQGLRRSTKVSNTNMTP